MSNKILLIDEDRTITDNIKINLEKEGFKVEIASNGAEGIENIRIESPDLIILDIDLPDKNGLKLIKDTREEYKMPIIILTWKDDESTKVKSLDFGADDYLVKPCGVRELIARIKANLRRVESLEEFKDNKISIYDLEIDLVRYEVTKAGKIVDLTLREFDLLKFLCASPGQVFTREELLSNVWDYEYYGDLRTVDVTVRRLREKVEDKDGDFKYIITKRGLGYYCGGY